MNFNEGHKLKCDLCDEEFKSKERLEGHIAFKHDRSKLLNCQFCQNVYRKQQTLDQHVDFVHKNIGKYFMSRFENGYCLEHFYANNKNFYEI